MKKAIILFTLCIILGSTTVTAADFGTWDAIYLAPQSWDAVNYNIYHNARFGYAVAFPNYLSQYGELPANNDGITLKTGEETTLYIWGSYNVLDETPESLLNDDSAFDIFMSEDSLSYYRIDGDIEAFRFQKIGSIIFSFQLEYPKTEHEQYREIIDVMLDNIVMP